MTNAIYPERPLVANVSRYANTAERAIHGIFNTNSSGTAAADFATLGS